MVIDGEVGQEAGMAASLRGLPLGLAVLAAAAMAAASAAASAGVLHQHPHTRLARSGWTLNHGRSLLSKNNRGIQS